ncbi:hypothetical protein [Longispora albida]|uniref:hypothetical protein n=1 Tax=Longispora albida TaxID=203523 RepID=UPI0003677BB3|nr:hypothetical protein [Longispora albida]
MIRRTLLAAALVAGGLFAGAAPANAIPVPPGGGGQTFLRILYYSDNTYSNMVGVHIPGPWCGAHETYRWGTETTFYRFDQGLC